jgi:hypothetical protein
MGRRQAVKLRFLVFTHPQMKGDWHTEEGLARKEVDWPLSRVPQPGERVEIQEGHHSFLGSSLVHTVVWDSSGVPTLIFDGWFNEMSTWETEGFELSDNPADVPPEWFQPIPNRVLRFLRRESRGMRRRGKQQRAN